MHVIRFHCPRWRCHRSTPIAVHTTTPDRRPAAIAHAACTHITPAEQAQLAAGTVPEQLTVRGER